MPDIADPRSCCLFFTVFYKRFAKTQSNLLSVNLWVPSPLSPIFILIIYFTDLSLCMSVLPACMDVYRVPAWGQRLPAEDIRSPGTRGANRFE